MRRWMLAGLLAGLGLTAGAFLTRPICPDYSGLWYSAGEQQAYVFQDGLISMEGEPHGAEDGESFRGAYCPADQKLLLFVLDIDGLEQERELYLIKQNGKEALWDREDGIVFFYRQPTEGVQEK